MNLFQNKNSSNGRFGNAFVVLSGRESFDRLSLFLYQNPRQVNFCYGRVVIMVIITFGE